MQKVMRDALVEKAASLLSDGTVSPSFFSNLLLCGVVFAPAAILYLLGLKLFRVRFS